MSQSNPLFRKPPEDPRPPTNRYERFGWKQNPFPDKPGVIHGSGDPRSNGMTYQADIREREQKQFDQLLIHHQPPRTIVLLMDYATRRGRGIGKTAFLTHQHRRVMSDLGYGISNGQRLLFASHLSPPPDGQCRKFWQLARLIAQTLWEQGVLARAIWRLRAFSGKIPEAVMAGVQDDPVNTIGNDAWLNRQGVSSWDLDNSVEKLLIREGVSEENATSLVRHGYDDAALQKELLSRWTENDWRTKGGQLVFDDLVLCHSLSLG
jgi:hypothetical protein